MTYNPNLKDARVLKRIKRAYGFAKGVLSENPHRWSTRYIDKYFGHQGNDLGKWLRQQLLTCTNEAFNKNTGLTKEYKLNKAGVDYLHSVLNNSIEPAVYDQQIIKQWIESEFKAELESRKFNYEDKSNRLWHPIQSLRREHKTRILA